MTVINPKIKIHNYIFLLVILLGFSSCENERHLKAEEESFNVFRLLIEEYIEDSITHPSFPVPPGGNKFNYSINDSLKIFKNFYESLNKEKTIALTFGENGEVYADDNNCESLVLFDDVRAYRTKKHNMTSMLNQFFKDSIFLNRLNINDFYSKPNSTVDFLISFSDITFNSRYNKAYLNVSVIYGRLDGTSYFVYLEKEGFLWKIKCHIVLSTS